jgi:hypothetical protein
MLVHVLSGVVMVGGAWLVGQVLTPMIGTMSYAVSTVLFMAVGYALDGILRKSGQGKAASFASRSSVPSPYSRQSYYPSSQQMQNPVQAPPQTKTRYAPEQVREMVRSIIAQYNAGQIDRVRYDQLLADLVFRDAFGRWFTVNDRTGRWVQHKDGAWVEAEPSQWLEK